MNKKLFPSFDDIEKGYCVYPKRGKFKGYDDYGEAIFSQPLFEEVAICHFDYWMYLTIEIGLDRQRKRKFFHFGKFNYFYPYQFEFSEKGYNEMLKEIERCLEYDISQIGKLLGNWENINEDTTI